jgi:DNA repair protein RecO (recombination protein O)
MIQDVLLEPAFVLHTRPYRNTSLIVELLTERHGRQTVVARSARGSRSRYQGKLQLFVPLLVSFRGQGELKSLTSAELSGVPLDLLGRSMMCGFYLNELLVRLMQKGDEHRQIYLIYVKTLYRLVDSCEIENDLRIFEKALLSELGYGLNLTVEANTREPICAQQNYRYVAEQGFILLHKKTESWDVYSGASIRALEQETWSEVSQKKDAKRLMRQVLSCYLGNRPLKSRECLV